MMQCSFVLAELTEQPTQLSMTATSIPQAVDNSFLWRVGRQWMGFQVVSTAV